MTRGRGRPLLLQVLLGIVVFAVPTSLQPATHQQPHRQPHSHTDTHTKQHPQPTPDNNVDINSLPETERKQFLDNLESSLMATFGISRRPGAPRRGDKTIHIPKRMQLLYEQLNGYEEGTLEQQLKWRRRRVRQPPGNTVRSFYYKDLGNSTGADHLGFDITSFPESETLHEAQFHLHHAPSEEHPHRNHSISPHRIDIYQVLQQDETGKAGSQAITRLLDTKTVHPQKRKWYTFDISSAVHHWRHERGSNHGLHVQVQTPDGRVSPHRHHVRLRRSAKSTDLEWTNEQPYVVTYSDDSKGANKKDRKKTRQRTRRSKKKNRKQKHKKRKNMCKRHKLYVDFRDVGWNDWIVAPVGYEAYYCHGDCPFYLPDNLNTTNHAVVQSLVHSVNPQAVPKPCCVPTELSPMSMLYMNYDDNVVLKTYRDMVVEACGCR